MLYYLLLLEWSTRWDGVAYMGFVFLDTNGFIGIAGLSWSVDEDPGGGHTRFTFTGLFSVFGFGKMDLLRLVPLLGLLSLLEGVAWSFTEVAVFSLVAVALRDLCSLLLTKAFSVGTRLLIRLLAEGDSDGSLVILFGDLTPASCTFRWLSHSLLRLVMLPVLDRFSFPLCSAQFSVSAVGLVLDRLLLSCISEDSIQSSTDLETFLSLDFRDSKSSATGAFNFELVGRSVNNALDFGEYSFSPPTTFPSQSFFWSLLTFFTLRLSNISETSCKAGELEDKGTFSAP